MRHSRRIYPLLVLSLPLLFATLSLHEPPPPLALCTSDEVQAAQLPPYTLSEAQGFAQIELRHFVIGGSVYPVRGVNYFPAHYPWRHFLAETDEATLETEFTLLRDAGLNTLRIFLWYEALFQCPGSGAVPNVANFQRLDMILHQAATHDLRLIVTLNDILDLSDYPLYSNPHYVNLQTAMIVSRYHDEAAILIWDLRNEGDIDYGSTGDGRGGFTRVQVLRWLEATSKQVRALDSNHLMTAGWLNDLAATAPYVDFLSFHHWANADSMRHRVAEIRAESDKPILLEEFGYSTLRVSPQEQAQSVASLIKAAQEEDLMGWLVWTAFDFPLDATCWPGQCVDVENQEHHFGLWSSDYTPKPAADALRAAVRLER